MFNHAPPDYKCPICLAIDGIESSDTMMLQDDVFYRDDLVMAVVNSKFIPSNPGHIIIVPLKHFENIFDLPELESQRINKVAKAVAIALKEVRKCDGVMLQQNNEPASGQHAFHYHLHLFPRFTDDQIQQHMLKAYVATAQDRHPYSLAMKEYFKINPINL